MNWDQVKGKWKQLKGQTKEKWGKLTDDDLDVIDGRRQQLVGRIQERYGIAKEEAEEQADEFVKALKAEDREEKERSEPAIVSCNTAGMFRTRRYAMAEHISEILMQKQEHQIGDRSRHRYAHFQQ